MEFELKRLNQQSKTLQQHAITIDKVVNDIVLLTSLANQL